MKNKSDADDIFQEVFLRLVQNTHKLHSEEHAKAWLIRVTINCCKQHFLSSWNKKTTGFDEMVLPAEIDTGERELYDAVMRLGESHRTVIHLFYYEGYSIAEISSITGEKENTVKSQLRRARLVLREQLKEVADFEQG